MKMKIHNYLCRNKNFVVLRRKIMRDKMILALSYNRQLLTSFRLFKSKNCRFNKSTRSKGDFSLRLATRTLEVDYLVCPRHQKRRQTRTNQPHQIAASMLRETRAWNCDAQLKPTISSRSLVRTKNWRTISTWEERVQLASSKHRIHLHRSR